jgi:hypothetical protein
MSIRAFYHLKLFVKLTPIIVARYYRATVVYCEWLSNLNHVMNWHSFHIKSHLPQYRYNNNNNNMLTRERFWFSMNVNLWFSFDIVSFNFCYQCKQIFFSRQVSHAFRTNSLNFGCLIDEQMLTNFDGNNKNQCCIYNIERGDIPA